ncbi:MAG: uncharacterized protein KVP18_002071 [Porospora cf. gigantea A]|uniref:uncharacterized protein n=1 Tax=Porospora cf. gigantea A TaxID=2853593 RepID=UPI00355A2A7D|nr:MAG: hypothetical protein KVP18_002071 [Porospora cf. gigantea A]
MEVLVLLGSGGHTRELLPILQRLGPAVRLTVAVHNTDLHSARKLQAASLACMVDIRMLPRARSVHQG